jgi:hypothetical protein
LYAKRVTYVEEARLVFVSMMEHLKVLYGDKGFPYKNVAVLPHVDYADPIKDSWELTE